jgi:hypothetical protein
MSRNPHPDAGKPENLNSIGSEFECIPCLCRRLSIWVKFRLEIEQYIERQTEHAASDHNFDKWEAFRDMAGFIVSLNESRKSTFRSANRNKVRP